MSTRGTRPSHGLAVLLLASMTPQVAHAHGLPGAVLYGGLFVIYAMVVTVAAAFFMKGSGRARTLGLLGGVILGVVLFPMIVAYTASGPLRASYTLGMGVVCVGVACAIAINRLLCKLDRARD